MADDRYSWLDEDAAERLLRGEPVDAAVGSEDACARTQAERLAVALADVLAEAACNRMPGPRAEAEDGLTAGELPGGELPGEAAAASAFRKAVEERKGVTRGRSTREDSARPSPGGPPKDPKPLHTSRIARVVGPLGSWCMGDRSLRVGLAAGLAGCVLGGVGIAAGTGVLPFGGEHGKPMPEQSVSAATAEPNPSDPSVAWDARQPSPAPHETSPSGEGRQGSGAWGEAGGSGSLRDGYDSEPAESGGRSSDATQSARDGVRGRHDDELKGAVAQCRTYEAGALDRRTKQRLEQAAGGAARVDRYCGRLLDTHRGDGTGPGHGEGRSGDDGSVGDGDPGGRPRKKNAQPSEFTPLSGEPPALRPSPGPAQPAPPPGV
jgi:hypothetical protein